MNENSVFVFTQAGLGIVTCCPLFGNTSVK